MDVLSKTCAVVPLMEYTLIFMLLQTYLLCTFWCVKVLKIPNKRKPLSTCRINYTDGIVENSSHFLNIIHLSIYSVICTIYVYT